MAIVCTTNRYHVGGMVSGLVGTGLVLQNNAGDDLAVTAEWHLQLRDHGRERRDLHRVGEDAAARGRPRPVSSPPRRARSAPPTYRRRRELRDQRVHRRRHHHRPGRDRPGPAEQRRQRPDGHHRRHVRLHDARDQRRRVRRDRQDAAVGPDADLRGQPGDRDGGERQRHQRRDHLRHQDVRGRRHRYRHDRQRAGPSEQPGRQPDASPTTARSPSATPIASGSPYAVTVLTQPRRRRRPARSRAAAGTSPTRAVTNIAITCTTNNYTVGGTVVGLTGSGLILRNNGGADLAVTASGSFTFPALFERQRLRGHHRHAADQPRPDLHAVGRDRHGRRRQRHLGDRQLQHRPARRQRHRHRPGRRRADPGSERRHPAAGRRQRRLLLLRRGGERSDLRRHRGHPAADALADLHASRTAAGQSAPPTSPTWPSPASPTATRSAATSPVCRRGAGPAEQRRRRPAHQHRRLVPVRGQPRQRGRVRGDRGHPAADALADLHRHGRHGRRLRRKHHQRRHHVHRRPPTGGRRRSPGSAARWCCKTTPATTWC